MKKVINLLKNRIDADEIIDKFEDGIKRELFGYSGSYRDGYEDGIKFGIKLSTEYINKLLKSRNIDNAIAMKNPPPVELQQCESVMSHFSVTRAIRFKLKDGKYVDATGNEITSEMLVRYKHEIYENSGILWID